MKTNNIRSGTTRRPRGKAVLPWATALFTALCATADAGYLTRQITTSAGKTEDHLRISGSRMVWHRKFSTDFEIYAYDGASVLQLTNNGTDDSEPEISGDRLVYLNGTDVLCYDFTTGSTSNLTNDSGWQMDPRIDGDFVYWIEWDAVDLNRELVRMDLRTGSRTNLSNNTLKNDHNSDSNLRIHGNRAAWIAWNSTTTSSSVLFNDGTVTRTLGDHLLSTYAKCRVTADHVLWLRSDPGGTYLCVYDGTAVSEVDVTAHPVEDIATGPEGIFVTWSNPSDTGGNQLDIYRFDPGTLTFSVIEENDTGHDQYVAVGDGMIAWSHDVSDTSIDDALIVVRDLATGTTVDVSEEFWVDQWTVASGRNVAWRGYDFGRSGEIEVFVAYWLGAGAALSGVDLSGEDLSGLVFTGADLRGANLTGAAIDAGALAGARINAATLFPDGGNFTTTSHDLTGITLPSPFEDWLADRGLSGTGGLMDSDGDGSSNLMEFALAGDAAAPTAQPVIRTLVGDSDSDGQDEFQLLIAVRRGSEFGAVGSGALGADIDGIRYRVEGAGNLTDYFEDLVFIGRSDSAPAGTGLPALSGTAWEYVRFRFATRPASGTGFMKVAVTREP